MMKYGFNIFIMIISMSSFTFATGQDKKNVEEQSVTLEEASMAAVNASLAEKSNPTEKSTLTSGSLKSEKSENEIPLHLDQNKKDNQDGGSLFRILFSFSIFGLLLTGAYYFLKNKVKSGQDIKKTQIRILTQHYLGPKKSLAIIRVAGESILIGITESNINLIKPLSLLDEELPEETPQNFAKVIGKLNQQDFAEEVVNAADVEDEFSIKGVKDVVTKKLRNMRNLE